MSADKGQIEQLAYHLWEEEGRPEGRDVDFWLRAEARLAAPAAAAKGNGAAKPKADKPAKAAAKPKAEKAPAKPRAAKAPAKGKTAAAAKV